MLVRRMTKHDFMDGEIIHLEASYLLAENIIKETPIETFLYLEEKGVSTDQYYEILLLQCDGILVDSVKTLKPAEAFVDEFSIKWNEYLMQEEYAYFLCSAMRGLGLKEHGPEIRLTWWNIELAFLLEEHPVHSLNISRGQGKSWFVILYLMFLCYRYRKKKGSVFSKYSMAENLLIFAGDDLGKQHIRQMTSWCEGNYVIWNRLAKGRSYQPSATLMRFANGAQLISKSFMSAARGFRATLFIDDYNLEEFNMNTMVQDKMFERITKAFFPIASNPFAQVLMAATPISPTDLIQRLWKEGGSRIMKWEYCAINRDGTILDHNLQPMSRILERRETYSKRAFLQEILLHADVEIDRIFTWSILEHAKDESYSYAETFDDFYYKDRTEQVLMGNDYSFSTSDVSDYNAFTTIAWTEDIFGDGMFRLFNLFYKQVLSLPGIAKTVYELYHKLQVDVIYSESNGMQTAISDMLSDMGLNVQKMNTTSKFKLNATQGIPVLASLMELDHLKFPYKTDADKKLTDMIMVQFYNMIVIEQRGRTTKFEAAAGNHDDIVLGVSQAILGSKIIDKIKLVNGKESDEWNRMIEREEEQRNVMLGLKEKEEGEESDQEEDNLGISTV